MAWHTSLLVIEGDHADSGVRLLADLGFPDLVPLGVVSGDEAGRNTLAGRAIGPVQGWTLIWDPTMFVVADPPDAYDDGIWSRQMDASLGSLSKNHRVYSLLTIGSCSTHAFAWYAGGRRKRLRLWQQGEVLTDIGEPLSEEVEAFAEEDDEEQRLFLLMEKLTGVTIGDAMAQPFHLLGKRAAQRQDAADKRRA